MNAKIYSAKKLYDMLLPDVKKICEKYNYLNLDDDYVLSLCLDLLKNANLDDFNKLKGKFLNDFESILSNIVYKKLQEPDSFSEIVKNFSSKKLAMPLTYKGAIAEINKLLDFLKKYRIILTPNLALDISSNNPILNNILKVIVDNNIEIIKAGDIDRLFDDPNILFLIEIYCSNNNIKTKQDSYLDDSLYDFEEDFITDDIVQDFISKIRKIPSLSPEKNKELLLKAKDGNINARNKFVYSNMRLVVYVVKKYRSDKMPFTDLIQEGIIGLMTAIDRFDFSKNCEFSTYACLWIKQAIMRATEKQARTIRVPSYMVQKINRFRRTMLELTKELGCEPSIEEIATRANISIEEAIKLNNLQNDTISLNKKIGDDDGDDELECFIADEQMSVESQVIRNLAASELKKLIQLSSLTEREIKILIWRKGLFGCREKTLEEIGESLKITRERVRQIEEKAIKKLTKTSKKNHTFSSSGIYTFFYQYKESEIDWAINQLTHEEKTIILLILNGNFSKRKLADLYNCDYTLFCKKFNEIVLKIKNLINQQRGGNGIMKKNVSKKDKTLYEYLKEYSKDEIDKAIEQLSSDDKTLLKETYGIDFNCVFSNAKISSLQLNQIFEKIIPKIVELINSSRIKTKKVQSLHSYLGDYSRDDLDAVIKSLPECEQELFYLRFGEDYSRLRASKKLTPEEKKIISSEILPKIKKILEGGKQDNCVNGDKEVKEPISSSNLAITEDSERLSNIDATNNKDDESSQNFQKEDIIRILEILRTPSFEDMLKVLSVKEATIISLRLGYVDGKYFTSESIANFLGISTLEVIETTKRVMELYKESINELIDSAIKHLNDDNSDSQKQKKINFQKD